MANLHKVLRGVLAGYLDEEGRAAGVVLEIVCYIVDCEGGEVSLFALSVREARFFYPCYG